MNMPQCKSTVTPIGRVEVEQRRERKGVHPSKTPTQEGKSSSRLPALNPTAKQALADKRCRTGCSYHHPQPQELLPRALQRLDSLCVLSLTQRLPSFSRAPRDGGDVTVFLPIALQGN